MAGWQDGSPGPGATGVTGVTAVTGVRLLLAGHCHSAVCLSCVTVYSICSPTRSHPDPQHPPVPSNADPSSLSRLQTSRLTCSHALMLSCSQVRPDARCQAYGRYHVNNIPAPAGDAGYITVTAAGGRPVCKKSRKKGEASSCFVPQQPAPTPRFFMTCSMFSLSPHALSPTRGTADRQHGRQRCRLIQRSTFSLFSVFSFSLSL